MPRLLELENLTVRIGQKVLVDGVGFTLDQGASLGILGESGSGKSLTCKAIIGLLPEFFQVGGQLIFQGQELFALSPRQRREMRGRRLGYIMQNPMTAFDPLMSIGAQMAETFRAHYELPRAEALKKAAAMLEKMLIREPERVLGQYPHELSGGMLQRVMIALTLSLEPDIIIADDILVMHGGQPVEYGTVGDIFASPESPHTRYLFNSRLVLMRRFHEQIEALEGAPEVFSAN